MNEKIEEDKSTENKYSKSSKIDQEQIHDLLFGEKLSWQAIIYELINTEQLNPWDLDLILLANKYLEKIRELEEANFFVSSKVILAAALLLRIKSEILLNDYIQSLDDILFGKKEEKKYVQERIELDEEIPQLIPRTPLPRFKKVSLQELMAALGKAIHTETRRIRKVVLQKQQEIETAAVLPKKTINIQEKIRNIYGRLKEIFSKKEERLAFSEFAGNNIEDKIMTFVPLLHLDSQHKVLLEQEGHLEEIWIWLKYVYDKVNKEKLEKMKKEVEEELEELSKNLTEEERGRAERVEKEFENPLGD